MPYIRSFLKIGVFLIILFSAITLYNHGSHSLPRIDSVTLSRGASDNTTPRGASWKSWFHPLRVAENNKHKKPVKGWNLFEHLGGYGPWIEKVDEQGVLTDLAPPEGCSINQVHLVWTFIFFEILVSIMTCSTESEANECRCLVMRKDTPQNLPEIVC